MEKNGKFEKVIRCHLGVIGKAPAFYRIALHHYPITLLKWQSQKKKCPWMNPLMKEEAIRFGTAHDKIDCHPGSKKESGEKGRDWEKDKK